SCPKFRGSYWRALPRAKNCIPFPSASVRMVSLLTRGGQRNHLKLPWLTKGIDISLFKKVRLLHTPRDLGREAQDHGGCTGKAGSKAPGVNHSSWPRRAGHQRTLRLRSPLRTVSFPA